MSTTTSETLKTLAEQFDVEHTKFSAGTNAAGARARKVLQEIIKTSKEARKAIQEEKNARKGQK
jgi:aspartate-semialdehyde dehydrogenase